ncbi:MAG: dihydroxyacetone kinase subunit DhaL [Methylococcaceae bacterium]|nr:dihydroxyacetone kinase subunit DhaL [Methylococcaceae bacterium]MDP3903501.1 dihydroxyacetone kinase subunit DhaL [Methylococcaceae bacterium]
MKFTPSLLRNLIQLIANELAQNTEEVAALDQAIGDGDHMVNLQRGINGLLAESAGITQLDWAAAFKKIGMTLMTAMGGASGSLYGTLFIAMSKATKQSELTLPDFAEIFSEGVQAVKQRGKAEAGEKTMLDVLIPVAESLRTSASSNIKLTEVLNDVSRVAIAGMESTRDMVATKGRASFLEERSRGHIDPGARTCQLIICVIVNKLAAQLPA